ncbi:MAG TPA: ABC transporter permease [Opitutaceae bacterium]|nr:ABC transporter permease [Opitutaceae bacterium]
MIFRHIMTVYGKELRDSLRDRRTLMSMFVVPMFLVPALTLSIGRISMSAVTRAREETPKVMLLGGGDSPAIVAALKQSPKFKIVPASDDYQQLISDKKVRAAIRLPDGFEAGLKSGAVQQVTLYYYEGELKSGFAAGNLERFFNDLRDRTVAASLAAHGLPASLVKPFTVGRENVAPPEKVGGNEFGGFVPYLIILLCFTGAIYPAIDLTAGEKERGTMETLLCSQVGRVEIVLGKFFMVLTSSLCAMVFSLMSMAATFIVTGVAMGRGAPAIAAAAKAQAARATLPTIDPLGIFGVLAMVLPAAVLFSALLLTISLFAKSAKEAQSYVTPLVFLVILPAVIGILPGIELDARLALVPLLNLSLVCREMMSGVWHWHYIALIFASTCVYAGVALALCVRMFNREEVIFRV